MRSDGGSKTDYLQRYIATSRLFDVIDRSRGSGGAQAPDFMREIGVVEVLLKTRRMTTAASAHEFTQLTAPHLNRLYRLGMRLTRQPSESADLVQEALCRAWASWSRFEGDGSIGAYLSRILYNTFVSRHRHARVVAAAAVRSDLLDHLFDRGRMDAAHEPERAWHRSELSDEVLAALDQLPEHYRRVVELVDLQGLAYKEAADELGVPLGTVMSRLHRARRIMRGELTSYARSFGYGPAMAAAA